MSHVQVTLSLKLASVNFSDADIKRFSKTFKRLSQACPSLPTPNSPQAQGLKEEDALPPEMQQKDGLDFISVLSDV